jgi:ariadne-1
MNHMQSLKSEHKLHASVKEKMEETQQHDMPVIEAQLLKKAVDILCQCRPKLIYTYVFAYYLRKNKVKEKVKVKVKVKVKLSLCLTN